MKKEKNMAKLFESVVYNKHIAVKARITKFLLFIFVEIKGGFN